MTSLADTFDRADAGTLGAAWKEYTNGFHVVSGAAVCDTTATNVAQLVTALATGDLEAEIEVGNTYGGSFTGVAVRMPVLGASGTDTGAFYLLLLSGTTGKVFSIQRKAANASTLTSLATGTSSIDARVDGTVWRLRAVQSGADVVLTGYVNDVQVVTFTDTSGLVPATQRRVGIYTGGATGPDMRFARIAAADVVAVATDTTPPTVPGSVTVASAGGSSVTVNWAASTDAVGVASYRVRRDGADVATAVTGTSYTDTGVPTGAHSYTVSAVDAAGNRSAESTAATVTLTPPDTAPPPVPTGLTATAGVKSVALSWSPVTAADLVGYRLFRGGTLIATLTGTSHVDTGLTPGTAYSYTVAAYDQAGNVSAGSTAATATPTAPAGGSTGPTLALWNGTSETVLTVDGLWNGAGTTPITAIEPV